jgi:hypothetical protein
MGVSKQAGRFGHLSNTLFGPFFYFIIMELGDQF